jgi:hypothetical protein
MFKRFTSAKAHKPSTKGAKVAAATGTLTNELAILWWRWRHLYLEAKQLEVERKLRGGV